MNRFVTSLAVGLLAVAPQGTTANPCFVQKVVASNVVVAQPVTVAVPVTATTYNVQYLNQDHYYSVQAAYQQKATLRELIRETVQELQTQGLVQPNPSNGSVGAQYLTQGKAQPTTSPAPSKALSVVMQKCAGCHNDADAKGGLKLVTQGSDGRLTWAELTSEQKLRAAAMAAAGQMPTTARTNPQAALTVEESRHLMEWALKKPTPAPPTPTSTDY